MATFYIEALDDGTVTWTKGSSSYTFPPINYGINDSTVPNRYTMGTAISLTSGQKLYMAAGSGSITYDAYATFTSTMRINAGGSLDDLVRTYNGSKQYTSSFFKNLFYNNTNLISIKNLSFANGIASSMYYQAFMGCTNLIDVPSVDFPTSVSEGCFYKMFSDCTLLAVLPKLPATSFSTGFSVGEYASMFYGCTSIKLSETRTSKYQTEFRIPTTGSVVSYKTNTAANMFSNTGGTFTGTPEFNKTYYLWTDSGSTCSITYNGSQISSTTETTPVSIAYNGSTIASLSGGTKTLKCNGEVMSTDVVVGSKTLKCSGELMASDVTVTVS